MMTTLPSASSPGILPPSLSSSTSSPSTPSPVRPKFHHRNTQDRLREGAGLYVAIFKSASNLQKGRRSVFKEMGLEADIDSGCSPVSDGGYASPESAVEMASPSMAQDLKALSFGK